MTSTTWLSERWVLSAEVAITESLPVEWGSGTSLDPARMCA